MSNLTFLSGSGFRIQRPNVTTTGITSAVDTTVQMFLNELDTLLAKSIIPVPAVVPLAAPPVRRVRGAARARVVVLAPVPPAVQMQTFVSALVARALTPENVPVLAGGSVGPNGSWDPNSLAGWLSAAAEQPGNLNLTEYIDQTAAIASIKYDLQNTLTENWGNLDYNTQAVLKLDNVRDYLVTFGFLQMNLTDVNGMANFIVSNSQGAQAIANYAIVSAVRKFVNDQQLTVNNINVDPPAGAICQTIETTSGLVISSASFQTSVMAVINDYVFNQPEYDIINAAVNAGVLLPPTDALKLQLAGLIKQANASQNVITIANAQFFIPNLLQQIQLSGPLTNGTTPTAADQDFGVDYLSDDQAIIQVSQTAVRCAAQLYYSMILGDKLDVFGVINYFTHKYLIRGSIEISDSQLRDDLQLYVFSSKFTDQKTNRINDRSRPAERQMFYRQVFNWGKGHTTPEVVKNREYPKLWKVLMLESAKYIERAQISPNPTTFVSRQNVMQAVEDLQYNLSTHCTGMANVITPLIYAELNFVIQRILMHPEILRQVVPQGGTWWRVVEQLYVEMKNTRPRSTVIYNEAKLGDQILRAVADYDSSTFEQDGPFGDFISLVDAFITTQSILQRGLTEDLIHRDDDEDVDKDDRSRDHDRDRDRDHDHDDGEKDHSPMATGMPGGMPALPGNGAMPGMPASATAPAGGGDEWAF